MREKYLTNGPKCGMMIVGGTKPLRPFFDILISCRVTRGGAENRPEALRLDENKAAIIKKRLDKRSEMCYNIGVE